MKLFFNLVLCTCAIFSNIESDGLFFKNSSVGIILERVINFQHDIITRQFMSEIFTNQESVNRTLDNLYYTLKRVYDILVDTNNIGLRNIMIGFPDTFERHNILNSNSILVSKTLSRFFVISQHDGLVNISKISELYEFYKDIFKENPIKIDKKEFIKIFKLYLSAKNIKYKDKKKYTITFDGLVLIEMLQLFISISQIQHDLEKTLPNNIFHHRPYYNFIQKAKELGICDNNKGYIVLSKNEHHPLKISNMYVNLFKSAKNSKMFVFTEQWYYFFHQTDVNPRKILEDILLKDININNNFLDLYIGQLHYISVIANTEIFLQIHLVNIFNSCVKLISFGSSVYDKLILEEFKENYESSEEMLALINRNIKEDKLHEFTTVVNMTTYTFKKPFEDSKPLFSACLRISCGHFLGKELLKEYIVNLKFKCHLCNIFTDVVNYFETVVYELN